MISPPRSRNQGVGFTAASRSLGGLEESEGSPHRPPTSLQARMAPRPRHTSGNEQPALGLSPQLPQTVGRPPWLVLGAQVSPARNEFRSLSARRWDRKFTRPISSGVPLVTQLKFLRLRVSVQKVGGANRTPAPSDWVFLCLPLAFNAWNYIESNKFLGVHFRALSW